MVAKAIACASSSGRKLSWKIQDNQRGTLVQLVWKNGFGTAGGTSSGAKVGINWNTVPAVDSARRPSGVSGMPMTRRSVPPSRKCRNDRRLQDFLLKQRNQLDGGVKTQAQPKSNDQELESSSTKSTPVQENAVADRGDGEDGVTQRLDYALDTVGDTPPVVSSL